MQGTATLRHGTEAAELQRFLDTVGDEVRRARANFPEGRHQIVALMEEVGELAQAVLKAAYEGGDSSAIYPEAVQVAAMAARVALEADPTFPRPLLPER